MPCATFMRKGYVRMLSLAKGLALARASKTPFDVEWVCYRLPTRASSKSWIFWCARQLFVRTIG